ncbi:MAG: TOBE domain-containing protein [Desulfobulbaceae bacterium]|nr:TOBE domain-containing protein [Desulfobulbaceae bacterium]
MKKKAEKAVRPIFRGAQTGQERIAAPDADQCLDTARLSRLEQSFREWAEATARADIRLSRQRILLIFLLIRYTGAKLNEVLSLDPFRHFDFSRHSVVFGNTRTERGRAEREVHLSAGLSREIGAMLGDPHFAKSLKKFFAVDPGFLRRKFYERAESCGFPKRLGSPEMIRKSRGAELLQNNMPLPAVQMVLGHATPSRTLSYLAFTEDEIRQIAKSCLERESARSSSARNVFWGKIQTIRRGDIQTLVVLVTITGHRIVTMITNNSLERLGLHEGKLTAAEIKAPWVIVQKGEDIPESSAENRFQGVITSMIRGKTSTEYVIRIDGGTELCAVASTESGMRMDLQEKSRVWALFNCFSVVLHIDE